MSESLLPITDLAIKKNGNAISLLMPPTRRPFAIQQSGLIFGGWDDSVLPVSSGDNGFFIIPIAADEAQRFFRVMLN